MNRLLSALALLLVSLPVAAQEAPVREVHLLTVFNVGDVPVFQIDGQTNADELRLIAGGTLVVQVLDSLQVLVFVPPDGLTAATEGPNAVQASPGLSTRAIRARPLRNLANPSGTTNHEVVFLVCTQPLSSGCRSWRPAQAYPGAGGADHLDLQILDGVSRGGGVRADDD